MGIKSAADGHLPEHLFGETEAQKDGSHEDSHKKLDKIPRHIHLGDPKELAAFHGKELECGTGRGKI
jgi:hypothetical protein